MANHKSAAKQARRNEVRRQRNRGWRSRMRTEVKKLRSALEAGDVDAARAMLRGTLGLIDRTARAGVLHDNTAARYKSRLQRAFDQRAAQA
ncbi:MAG: 30S ribosomal protein S20 [Acidobacteriota bacterium]|nr:MAG: 30S ribosomal protein S20 [Acidobacteriota bacterium]